jgi:LytS/YehU family sensor histidine kinase
MAFRAELYDGNGVSGFLEGLQRRILFALFGSLVSYVLYRLLRPLQQRRFGRRMAIGAAFTFVAACIQAALNTWMFNAQTDRTIVHYIYSVLYWFWFFFSWTAAYLALSYSIMVEEQERHAADLAVKAQEAQVSALRYQINPHFLFNTLNAIAALIRDAPSRAEEMVVRLSDFFRRSLAIDPTEDVTLSQEVELQRLYLEIERTRFPDRLRFEVALDDGSAEVKVPALLLQPLVENAVKHGVARSERPTCIQIRARVDGPVLEIVVENDAPASGSSPNGERVGLSNVRDRLRSRFGDEAGLECAEAPGGGFRNIIRIPARR